MADAEAGEIKAKRLVDAREHFAKAGSYLEQGKPDNAIGHYAKAWKAAARPDPQADDTSS